jgi:hypothetical protein
MKTPQELINEKANKIQHYSRDGFNARQTIELMEAYHAQFSLPEGIDLRSEVKCPKGCKSLTYSHDDHIHQSCCNCGTVWEIPQE